MPNDDLEPIEPPSVRDMQQWLEREIADATKARDMRISEASALTNAYAKGESTPAESAERQWRFMHRWGEALPGVSDCRGMTDSEILANVDEAAAELQGPYRTLSEIHTSHVKRVRSNMAATANKDRR